MSRDDRYRCEACQQFMDLDADDRLPLHIDADGLRMCLGSSTEDYERSRDCCCHHPSVSAPCSACENGYTDIGDGAPGEAACEHVKAAGRCGIYCPLLVRGDCPTPEAIMQLAPAAEALGSIRLQLECEPTRAVALRPAEARALLTALARLREENEGLKALNVRLEEEADYARKVVVELAEMRQRAERAESDTERLLKQNYDMGTEMDRLRRALWPFADYADTMYVHADNVMMFGHFTVGQFREAFRAYRATAKARALAPEAGSEGKTQ